MDYVHSILQRKGSNVVTIGPDATVFEAIQTMVDNNVGSILVMDGDDVEGIFTERDYLRRIALEGRTSKTTRVGDVMTSIVMTVTPGQMVSECMDIMTENKCRHLPVMEDGKLKGIVSIGDCVKQISQKAQEEAKDLRNYIAGKYPQ